jgi:TPR repeat protein
MLTRYEEGLRAGRRKEWATARRALEDAAEQGDAHALVALAQLASNGFGEPKDDARAATLYARGADLGDSEATFNLAALTATGRGVRRDMKAALDLYRRAADLGSVSASHKVALMLARGEVAPPSEADFAEAERRWRECAEKSHVGATYFLGELFNGLGPQRSASKAAQHYLQAVNLSQESTLVADVRRAMESLVETLTRDALAGDALAAQSLGGWHMTLARDHAKAAEWFERAAKQNDTVSLRSLGFLLLKGLGVPKDGARAVTLFDAAARAGDRFAQLNLGDVYLRGEIVERNVDKAIELLTAAADQGVVNAMALLGDELGRLDRDEEARKWYVRAAERGHAGAMKAAADYYRDGLGGARDLVQAVRWYWRMLDKGNGDGVHEIHQIAHELTEEQLFEAARLAGDATYAESLIASQARAPRTK